MKKKKLIIAGIFLTLILLTAIFTVVWAVKSYLYDMDPANGVDLLEGLGAVFIMIIGGFAVLYESDLFYTVYYFSIMPKTKAISVCNLLAHGSLILIFFCKYFKDIFEEDVIVPIILFLTYAAFRMCSLVLSAELPDREKGTPSSQKG